MAKLQLDIQIGDTEKQLAALAPEADAALDLLHSKKGPGNDNLGWLNLSVKQEAAVLNQVKAVAAEVQSHSQALVVVGVGGSYAGSRAAIEMLRGPFHNQKEGTVAIYFAGHNLSSDYHQALLNELEDVDFSVNVISKSGTTLEPSIAFRLLRDTLERRYGKAGACKRIIATTDPTQGALRELADREGYTSFAIPGDIGGRYSVLTPVGLLPMAVAGVDVEKVMAGAALAWESFQAKGLDNNPCLRYAAARNLLYSTGKTIELLVCYEPGLQALGEWWKQLFGESEGKDGKGLFPASAVFTTDLHSLGQFIQQGSSCLFETVLQVRDSTSPLAIPAVEGDPEGLNYLAGTTLAHVNRQAQQGTLAAHVQGGVPNMVLELEDLGEETFGFLVYFFMKACAVSGYMLGVNPFDQPGVEMYKEKIRDLLKDGQEG